MGLVPNISWILFALLLSANVLSPKAFSMAGGEGDTTVFTMVEDEDEDEESNCLGEMVEERRKSRNYTTMSAKKARRCKDRLTKTKGGNKSTSTTNPSQFDGIKSSASKAHEGGYQSDAESN